MATPSQPYVFAFNGYLFGGIGQNVQVLSVEGLEDVPTLRVQDEGRGYSDGMFTGRDFLNGRSITMSLQIMGDPSGAGGTATSMQTYLQAMKANLISQTTGTGVLQIYLPNRGVQRLNARVRRRSIKIDPEYTYGKAYAMVEFFCPDPRIYNDTLSSYPFSSNSGWIRSYNKNFNMTYSAGAGGQSSWTITNNGNYETFPVFTFTGTSPSPTIGVQMTNLTTSKTLSFPTVSLGANDVLIVDTDMKTITLNGAAARNLLANSSQWFSLPASTANTITYSTLSGTGTCTMTYRDAYI
jgi:hypothetical protein